MNKIQKTKISKFPTIDSLSKTDRLVVSTKKSESSYDSRYVSFGILCTNLLRYIELLKKCNPKGDLFFDTIKSVILIAECAKLTNVPSLQYVNEKFQRLIDDLEKLIYEGTLNERYIPSHVGQIVMGNNFVIEDDVKKIYGMETQWKQICGRFILGTGIPGENNVSIYGLLGDNSSISIPNKKFGGQQEAILATLAPHAHSFKNADYKYFPQKKIEFPVKCEEKFKTYEIDKSCGGAYGRLGHGIDLFGETWFGSKKSRNTTHMKTDAKKDVFLRGHVEQKSFTFKAAGTVLENKYSDGITEQQPHNNLPPFYTTYIWERIK